MPRTHERRLFVKQLPDPIYVPLHPVPLPGIAALGGHLQSSIGTGTRCTLPRFG